MYFIMFTQQCVKKIFYHWKKKISSRRWKLGWQDLRDQSIAHLLNNAKTVSNLMQYLIAPW